MFARWYFGYESPSDAPAPGEKAVFFGDEYLSKEELERGAPSIRTAPPEIQGILEHFMKTRGKDGA